MLKGMVLYVIALYLLGTAVAWLQEASYSNGLQVGDHNGYERWLTGYQTGYDTGWLKGRTTTVSEDVHRES